MEGQGSSYTAANAAFLLEDRSVQWFPRERASPDEPGDPRERRGAPPAVALVLPEHKSGTAILQIE